MMTEAETAILAKLEKVLKPFAGSDILRRFADRNDDLPLEADETITLGDFRRAAAVLSDLRKARGAK